MSVLWLSTNKKSVVDIPRVNPLEKTRNNQLQIASRLGGGALHPLSPSQSLRFVWMTFFYKENPQASH